MNTKTFNKISSLRVAACIAVGSAMSLCQPAHSQIVTLDDGGSRAFIDTATSTGMYDWFIDGTDHLAQQWFWYRLDNNPESSIDTISAPAIVQNVPNVASVTYANNLLSLRVDYTLAGGLPGSGTATITESIRVDNLSGTFLNFHFFQYSDFDLNGQIGGDVVTLGKNGAGKYNEALQTKSFVVFQETVLTPAADHGEASIFPNTVINLTDGLPTTLSDVDGPIGPGDATWAFQWDVVLAPTGNGSSFLLSKTKTITVVPEPTGAALAMLGLALGGYFRRNRQGRN